MPTARLLAEAHTVYVPDLPGFGLSKGPRKALTITQLADALAAYLDTMNIEKPVLVANSLGCQVIIDFAVRYPGRASHLVLKGPTMDPSAPTIVRQFFRLLLDATREPLSQVWLVFRDYLMAGPVRVYATVQYGLRHPTVEQLPQVDVPVLVMRGGRDPIVTHEWCEQITALIPDARLATIEGEPHTVNYTAPGECVELIRAFLGEVPGHKL